MGRTPKPTYRPTRPIWVWQCDSHTWMTNCWAASLWWRGLRILAILRLFQKQRTEDRDLIDVPAHYQNTNIKTQILTDGNLLEAPRRVFSLLYRLLGCCQWPPFYGWPRMAWLLQWRTIIRTAAWEVTPVDYQELGLPLTPGPSVGFLGKARSLWKDTAHFFPKSVQKL